MTFKEVIGLLARRPFTLLATVMLTGDLIFEGSFHLLSFCLGGIAASLATPLLLRKDSHPELQRSET